MRAVMSGGSMYPRPRRNASKKRGGSKMRSSTSVTRPSRVRMNIPPSPSTRARAGMRRVRFWVLAGISFALLAEGVGPGVERPEGSNQVWTRDPGALEPARKRRGVRGVRRTEAAVAAPTVGRAECTATGLRHRPETGRAGGNHHADVLTALALETDAVRGYVGPAPDQEGREHFDQLTLVDRTAPQLEVDRHVRRDRSRTLERRDVLGTRVHDCEELLHRGEVAQGLDAAGAGAGAYRDQVARRLPNGLHPLDILGRRDGPLDQREIVGSGDMSPRRLGKRRDVHRSRDGEKLVLAVEQRQLAAVAGGELPDSELGPSSRHQTSRIASRRPTRA